MSAGGARRGRRDNGLDAADYAAAGDVDPRVGEHLLDVLAAGGIAAYLQPSADRDPIFRATTFPATPTDRLYVDREHLDTARDHLQKLTQTPPAWSDPTADPMPGSSPAAGGPARPGAPAPGDRPGTPPGGDQTDVDAEWARIVAGFHTAVDPAAPPWPEAEGIDPARATEPPPPEPAPPAGEVQHNRRRTDRESLLDGLDTFGTGIPDDDEDEDERYVPPPPPPLPHVSKYAIAGVLGVVVGFVLFLFPTLLPIEARIVTLMGFAAIVAGAVTLVWRLRSGDDEDEDDDGAVV